MTGPKPGSAHSSWAAALLDPGLPVVSGLTAWNGSDPASRFAVHRNNVMSSLIDALAQTFPVVLALVGVEFFRAAAAVFVRNFPPTSKVLAGYGGAFPEFLSTFPPAQGVPYLPDVAVLEMARVKAYHAADAAPVSETAVMEASSMGDAIRQLQFVLHPSLSVFDSRFAAVSVWAAHQITGEVELHGFDMNVAESALVFREGLGVAVLPVSAGMAFFTRALGSSVSLGEAADLVGVQFPEFGLAEALSIVFNRRLVISLELSLES